MNMNGKDVQCKRLAHYWAYWPVENCLHKKSCMLQFTDWLYDINHLNSNNDTDAGRI